jgi:phosphate-selective porin OprO/OprP
MDLRGEDGGGSPQAPSLTGNDTTIAELQRRVAELDAMVRQMQAERTAGLPAAAAVPVPAADAAGPPAMPLLPGPEGPVSSSVPPRPTEREGIHTGAFPLAGWNEGFYLRAADGSYELHITGQIQADGRAFLNDVDTATSPDTFLIRRARLGIEATVFQYYEFRLLPDFAQSTVSKSITDAYINIHYWDALQFEAGKFKQPFSYEQLIQDRYVPFLERSLIDQCTPQRDEGVMIWGRKLFDDRFDYAVAFSNGEQNDSTIDVNNHKDFNGRLAFRPFNDPDAVWLHGLQIGIAGGYGVQNEPVSPNVLTTPATVEWFAYNAGVLASGLRDRLSPEIVYFHNSLGVAAQYFEEEQRLQLSAKTPIVSVPTTGYYAMVTYLLTGEHRYDYTQQIDPIRPFSPCRPVACPGAWEILWRISQLDVGQEAATAKLVTLATPGHPAQYSSLGATESTLGLNWYMNKWVRTQFNWEHAWFNSPVKIGNAPGPFTKEDALYARLQLIF